MWHSGRTDNYRTMRLFNEPLRVFQRCCKCDAQSLTIKRRANLMEINRRELQNRG